MQTTGNQLYATLKCEDLETLLDEITMPQRVALVLTMAKFHDDGWRKYKQINVIGVEKGILKLMADLQRGGHEYIEIEEDGSRMP